MMLFACIAVALALLAPAASFAAAPASPDSRARLSRLASEVRSADYRGDGAALARLDGELGTLERPALAEYRLYWQGFARWRRALNGFNETPTPSDLAEDLERAVAHFRASLALRPDWIEAKLAMAGCWGSLAYLAGDAGRRRAGGTVTSPSPSSRAASTRRGSGRSTGRTS